MIYTINRGGTFLKDVKPQGKVNTRIMDEELLTMSFSLDHFFAFTVGDTVEAYGNIYAISEEPTVQKVSTNHYNYQLKFTGLKYELGKIQLMFPDGNNNLTLGDFSINGDAETVIELIVENANRISSGWAVGTVDVTEVRNFTFTAVNLLAALAILADEYETEFWIDQDQSIHFQNRNTSSGLELQYGKDLGLHSITRRTAENNKIITRLYAFGSDKNLSNGYRDGSPRLKLPANYLENNVDKYGIIEHTEIFDDIYPSRVGTVTHVDANNPLKFRDTAIDFNLSGTLPNSSLIRTITAGRLKASFKDLTLAKSFDITAVPVLQYVNLQNQTPVSMLIPGVAAKVTFNSGQLAGYTFDIAAGGWNNTTKEITLVRNTDEKHLELPNDLMRPAVGDKYVITDIIMPESYVMAAENRLIYAAGNYLQKHSRPQLQYDVVPDHLYFRRNDIQLNIGSTVQFIDTEFGLNTHLRITSLVQDLQNPYDVQFELSESLFQLSFILKDVLDAVKKNIKEYQGRRNIMEVQRGTEIAKKQTIQKFERIGDLELLPVEGTLIGQVATLDELKIPVDAPIRTIDLPKIEKWDFANETAIKLGEVDAEIPNWKQQIIEQTNF